MTALFYLSDVQYGGWPTFTAHLARALEAVGDRPRLFKVGLRTESQQRHFGRGLLYRNLHVQTAAKICQTTPSIVAVAAPKFVDQAQVLLQAGAVLVIHDPTELKGEVGEKLLGATKRPVVVIREANLKHVPGSVYIPHPYERAEVEAADRQDRAICVARIDWDKHTDEIVAANMQLPKERRVVLGGAINPMYAHHKLRALDPEWKSSWQQGPNKDDLHAQVRRMRTYTRSVDLSRISGDGGGTQYTFLEALDAGVELVLHTGWLTGDARQDVMAPYATWVRSVEDLVDVLSRPPTPRAAEKLLAMHDPKQIGQQYRRLF